MKRRDKTGSSHGSFGVRPRERLIYRDGQWHVRATGRQKATETRPFELPVLPWCDTLCVATYTLECCLAIQDQILTPIYENATVGLDLFESAQGKLIHAIVEHCQTIIAYEQSIRISVEIILGRKLPYECPQDHTGLGCVVCRDCGMTLTAFSVISALKHDPSEPAPHGLFKGLRVNLDASLEDAGITGANLDPVTPVMPPFAVKTVEE